MSILTILQYPDSRLRRKGAVVTNFDDKSLQKLIDDMFLSCKHYDGCAALAATQLDVDNPPRLFVMNRPEDEGGRMCFVDPEITATEGEEVAEEGCMSVYPSEISVPLARAKNITAKAFDRHGKPFTINLSEFWARVVQHELDHLNGVLYIDRLSSLKRERVEKKVKKILEEKNS